MFFSKNRQKSRFFGLFLPVFVKDGLAMAVIVVMSQFASIRIRHAVDEIGLPVGVLAVGSGKGRPDSAAHNILRQCHSILLAPEFDSPEQFLWWRRHYPLTAVRWPLTWHNGRNVGAWIRMGLFFHALCLVRLSEDLSSRARLAACVEQRRNERSKCPVSASAGMASEDRNLQVQRAYSRPDEAVPTGSSQRWRKFGKSAAESSLPEGCWLTLDYLRRKFAGKTLTEKSLVPCALTKSPPWSWVHYESCGTCTGHPHCLLDLLAQEWMTAPLPPDANADPPVEVYENVGNIQAAIFVMPKKNIII
jgi:hypothetical protein